MTKNFSAHFAKMTVTSEAKTSVPRSCSNSCVVVPNSRGVSSTSELPVSALTAAGHSLLMCMGSDSAWPTEWGCDGLEDNRKFVHLVRLRGEPSSSVPVEEITDYFKLPKADIRHVVCPKLRTLTNSAGGHANGPCKECTWRPDARDGRPGSQPVVAFVEIFDTETPGANRSFEAVKKTMTPVEAASGSSTWSQVFDKKACSIFFGCNLKQFFPRPGQDEENFLSSNASLWKFFCPENVDIDRKTCASDLLVDWIHLDFVKSIGVQSKQ